LELGDVTRAERHLADVPAALQDTAGAWILRGAVRLARGDAVGALDAFERGLRLDPSCATGVLGVAESSLRLGRQDVAERIDAWLGAHDADEAVALGFARMLARRGHIDEALRRARTAREARPASETALRHLAAFLTEHGDPMAATVELTRAAERAPSERRTRLLLLAGRIRVRAGTEVQAALELARSQTGHEARTLESECLAELGDADAAELMAAREVERLPPSERALAARLRYVIGCASYHRGSADAAIAQFLACLDLDPLHAAAANNLAWIWVRNAATAGRGLDMARRATALTPLDPNVWDTRAACELAMHDGPAAEQSWRRAESLFAGQPRQRPALRGAAAMRLASYLASEKRSDEARAVARDVMQRAAGTPAAAKARDLLGAY
ncbi:MAG: hypothetical protein K8T90_03715, partial [Planctomycetes bacterium]|nr:hypothetical protein [Planctomycetota bacterium]